MTYSPMVNDYMPMLLWPIYDAMAYSPMVVRPTIYDLCIGYCTQASLGAVLET